MYFYYGYTIWLLARLGSRDRQGLASLFLLFFFSFLVYTQLRLFILSGILQVPYMMMIRNEDGHGPWVHTGEYWVVRGSWVRQTNDRKGSPWRFGILGCGRVMIYGVTAL